MFQIPERHLITLVLSIFVCFVSCSPVLSSDVGGAIEYKQAKSIRVKIGYFDLAAIKKKLDPYIEFALPAKSNSLVAGHCVPVCLAGRSNANAFQQFLFRYV